MKHKARLALTCLAGLTIVISLILFVELSADQWPEEKHPNYFDSNLGATQGHTHDGLEIHKSKKKLDLNFKKLGNIKGHINLINKDEDSPEELSLFHKTVMFDGAVERLLQTLDSVSQFGFTRDSLRKTKFKDMVLQLGRRARANSKLLLDWDSEELGDRRTSNYVRFHHHIRAGALYDPENPAINGLLHDMATDKITSVESIQKEGTHLRLLLRFRKGTEAIFKPIRWGRDQETLPDQFYFNDFERHNAEIAAFHLDRVLGFYRVPPVTGRLVNLTKEILPVAEGALKDSFHVSPVGNQCFFGECNYCTTEESVCGDIDMMEGSLTVGLPDGYDGEIDELRSPYRRSYNKHYKAEWETDEEYCNKLQAQQEPYLYERFISDLIDIHIFDFITGNMDRHHIEVFRQLRNDACPVHLDNGRGFGKANVDEFSIITPLRQCCQIRKSTFLKLAKLYIGPERLSEQLDNSMKSDPIYPIVLPAHLNAMDRRVLHILRIVAKCVEKRNSINKVIVNDNY